jgi:hypothetical protein
VNFLNGSVNVQIDLVLWEGRDVTYPGMDALARGHL